MVKRELKYLIKNVKWNKIDAMYRSSKNDNAYFNSSLRYKQSSSL